MQEKSFSRIFWPKFPFELSDMNSAFLRSPSRETAMKVLVFVQWLWADVGHKDTLDLERTRKKAETELGVSF